MPSIMIAFLAIGAIIFVGFISNLLFLKFKIPDVIILIVLGVLIGPGVLGVVDGTLLSLIEDLAPILSALALAMILFDAGMGLNYGQVLDSLPSALFHTILAFVGSMLVTGGICIAFLGWDPMTSVLLGSIVGGTSGAVVIPLINRMRMTPRTRTLLTIESALTDVLVIVVGMSIIFYKMGEATGTEAFGNLASAFFVSLMLGLIAGVLWLRVLARLEGQPFASMATVAVMLAMYAVTDLLVGLSGAGAVTALIFGLVLANREEFARVLRRSSGKFFFHDDIRRFHAEITFFVRTFFFVYLGLAFSMMELDYGFLILSAGIILGLLGVRLLAVEVTGRAIELDKPDQMSLFFMLARGLSAAVLASYPLAMGVVSQEIGSAFLTITVMVIVVTTVISCVGAFIVEKGH